MHKDATIELKKSAIEKDSCHVIFFYEGESSLDEGKKKLDASFKGAISSILNNGFKAEKGEMKLLYGDSQRGPVLLIGLGKKESIKKENILDLLSDGLKAIRSHSITKISIEADTLSRPDSVYLCVLASSVGLHRLLKFKTRNLDKVKNIEKISVMTKDPSLQKNQFDEAIIVSMAIKKTRDQVNSPPNISTTESVSEYAKKIAKENKLSCTLLGYAQMEKMGMGLITAVGKGSESKPKMVLIEYNGDGKAAPLAIIGKGITFDSGGYNLKPSAYILNMKDDKAGAITMLHVIEAVAKMKLKVNLLCVLAIAENLVSGSAYRPDDVLTSYNGITVEITNTDAEGRLVLGDALSYSLTKKPRAIIDLATLTGASLVAVGTFTTPFVGNDEEMIDRIEKASEKCGERVWQLPLWDEFEESIKSEIADIKNATESADAGVIIGGIFLKQFVGKTPWVHLDIGSTVWSKAEKGFKQRGATGVCTRLLIELVKDWK